MSMPFAFSSFAPARAAFDFWISFFPTAPLFGVRWRFADTMPPEMNPFAMPPASAFFMPGAAAPARPGELDTPACVPDSAAQTADVAGETVSAMSRLAAEMGRAAARMAGTAVESVTATQARTTDVAPSATPAPAENPADAAPRPAENKQAEAAGNAEESGEKPAETPASVAATGRTPKMLLSERPENADDLTTLKGIGAGLERQLNELGLYRLDQIAGMSESDLAWIDENLPASKGRCFRDDWVGQARARLSR